MWSLCSINDGKAEITSMPGTSPSPTPHKKCNDDTMTLGKYINYFCANSALSEFHSAMKTMHNISYNLGTKWWRHLHKIRGTQQQFSENICSEDDLRSRIFGTFVAKFLACLPLLGFSNI